MRKILAIRTDRFGEFLLNIPAFRAIKESYPHAHLTVAVAENVAPLARAIPFVDDVFIWPPMPMNPWQVLSLSRRLASFHFDAVIILNPSSKAHQAVFLAGIPQRVGYFSKQHFLLTHKLVDRKYLGTKHEVTWNLELAQLLGATTRDTSLILNVPAKYLKSVLDRFGLRDKEFVVVHPFTSDPAKQWPPHRFRELIRELACYDTVVVVGHPEEWQTALSFESEKGVVDLQGKTGLLELAAVLRGARMLVSGDSGPAHLACCVGTPVVALFRNGIAAVRPERWGPWGEGHRVVQAHKVEDIPLTDVLAATCVILSQPSADRLSGEPSGSAEAFSRTGDFLSQGAASGERFLKQGRKGLVSVVVPVYNRAYVVNRAINSVLAQTYKDLEIIVVDDGSSDGVADVLRDIKDPRVRYVRHARNKGVSAARNTGVRESAGEFVAFLDSDDAYFPMMIEKSLAVLQRASDGPDMVAVNYYVRNTLRNEKEPFVPRDHDHRKIFLPPSSWVVRRDVLFRAGLFDERIMITAGEDVEFFTRLRKACRFHLIEEPLLDKFQSADSPFADQQKMDRLKEATLENVQGDRRLYARQAGLLGKEFSGRRDKKRARSYYWRAFQAYPLNLGYLIRFLRG